MGQFLAHNPTQANQESDAAYQAESLRTGGIGTDAILPSAWLNKLFHQTSIFSAAFAQMLAAKNPAIVLDDADQNTIAAALAAIITSTNGLTITNSTLDSSPVGANAASTGLFTQLGCFGNIDSPTLTQNNTAPSGYHLVGDGSHYVAKRLVRTGNLAGGSRFAGQVYQNTSGGELYLTGWFNTAGGGVGVVGVNTGYNPSLGNIVWKSQATATVDGGACAYQAVIAPGEYYRVENGGAVNSLQAWFESTYQ